jgi:hypothetical protein
MIDLFVHQLNHMLVFLQEVYDRLVCSPTQPHVGLTSLFLAATIYLPIKASCPHFALRIVVSAQRNLGLA